MFLQTLRSAGNLRKQYHLSCSRHPGPSSCRFAWYSYHHSFVLLSASLPANLTSCIVSPHVDRMVSSNGESDIRPDRIQAREDQFHRDIRARRQSPVPDKRLDLTELGCMGAHLDLSKHEPWPSRLELTDSEAMHSDPVSTPISLDTYPRARTEPGSSAADESPTSRACTPTGCGAYLPSHEYKEFQRQRSVNSKFTYNFFV